MKDKDDRSEICGKRFIEVNLLPFLLQYFSRRV
jgi:hypothetical protein